MQSAPPGQAAAPQAPAPLPPFRPSCVMCVSDCDPDAIFTSCHHFICTRCVAKYPPGACPRCQKPCRALRIAAPNVAERIGGDVARIIQQASAVMDFQRRQEALTIQRLKELVTLFNGQVRSATVKVQETQAELERCRSDNSQLQQALASAEQKLRLAATRTSSASQVPVPTMSGYGGAARSGGGYADGGGGGYSAGQPMGPPPGLHHQVSRSSMYGQDPSAMQSHHQHQLQTAWISESPCRPPTGVGDLQGLFGHAVHASGSHSTLQPKRCRSEMPQHQGSALPPSPADRFVLATPAMTLRGGPPGTAAGGGGGGGGHPSTAPRLQSLLGGPPAAAARLVVPN